MQKQTAENHKYYKTGKQFLKYDENWEAENWFAELCPAEYKGFKTKANPLNSIKSLVG